MHRNSKNPALANFITASSLWQAGMVAIGMAVATTQAATDVTKYVGATYAMDDMSLATSPSLPNKMGVYFWVPKDEWYFKATMSRVADADAAGGIGYVSFVSTHTEKTYHPVGVSFGGTAPTAFTIDMSGEGGDSVSVEVENASTTPLRVRITLKDDADNMIDTKPDTPVDAPWNGAFEFDVKAKTTMKKSYAYKGGYYAEWKDAGKCNLFADGATGKTPCGIQKTNMARIAGANITINSTTPEATGITNADLRIRKMSFGSVPSTGVLGAKRQIPYGYPAELNAVRMGLVGYPVSGGRVFDIHGRERTNARIR